MKGVIWSGLALRFEPEEGSQGLVDLERDGNSFFLPNLSEAVQNVGVESARNADTSFPFLLSISCRHDERLMASASEPI